MGKKIAVVTGASSGMGREFVRQLDAAEPFDEVWAIARHPEGISNRYYIFEPFRFHAERTFPRQDWNSASA